MGMSGSASFQRVRKSCYDLRAAGGHLVEHQAKGEAIGARVQLLAPHLLGRHVAGGAHRYASAGKGVLYRGRGRKGRGFSRAIIFVCHPERARGSGATERESRDLLFFVTTETGVLAVPNAHNRTSIKPIA
jgi:hypothetical protein